MTIDAIITLIAAGLAFLASVVATGVAAYNGRFHRFAQQRWWEIKLDTYSRIVEALTGLVYYYEQRYDAELEGGQLSEDRRRQIGEFWKKGHMELKRAAAAGAFIISPTAAESLRQLWSAEKHKGIHPQNWLSLIEADYAAAEACLRTVVAAAQEDLDIASRRLRLPRPRGETRAEPSAGD